MRQLLLKRLKNQKGLTLIELLAVIVILGIIAAIAVPAIGNIMDNSRKDAHIANAEMFVNAARMAQIENVTKDVNPVGNEHDGGWSVLVLDSSGFLESIPNVPSQGVEYGVKTEVVISGGNYYVRLAKDNTLFFVGRDNSDLVGYVAIEDLRSRDGRALVTLNPTPTSGD